MISLKQPLKKWIKDNLYLLLLITIIGVSGCSRTPVLVYVNLNQISLDNLVKFEEAPKPKNTYYRTNNQCSLKLKAMPEQKILQQIDQKRAQLIYSLFEKNKENLKNEITKELTMLYNADIKKLEKGQHNEYELQKAQSMELIYKNLRQLFLKYAEPAGQNQYRLASLVGFPDPDPLSKRTLLKIEDTRHLELEEAQKIRAKLKELADNFQLEFGGLIKNLENESQKKLDTLAQNILKRYHQATLKAIQEAQKITESYKGDSDYGKQDLTLTLSAIEERKITFSTRAKKGITTYSFKPLIEKSKQKGIIYDVNLWAKLNSYTLTCKSNKGKDMTSEFIKWRKQYVLDTR